MTPNEREHDRSNFKKIQAENKRQNEEMLPGKKLARQPISDAFSAEQFSFSKFTLLGAGLFPLAIFFSIFFISGYPRLMLGTFTICLLVVMCGVVIDALRWRHYTEWGALGAIVAYTGLVVTFGMLIVFMVSDPWAKSTVLTDEESFLYPVMILLGGVIMFIGFTSRATEFDRKIEALIAKWWHAIRNFDPKLFLSSTLRLIGALIIGFLSYLWRGILELKARIRLFGKYIDRVIRHWLGSAWIFLTETVPRALRRASLAIWRNFHWIGLMAVIVYLGIFNLLIASGFEETYLKAELFIIVGFFFSLGVIYPHREQLIHAVQRVQDYSWEKMYSVNLTVRSLGATRRKMLCRSCDTEIPLSSTNCPSCTTGIEKCNICRLPLKGGEPTTYCEACQSIFHQNHWEQWIKRGSSCPVCRGQGLPPVEEKPVEIPTVGVSEKPPEITDLPSSIAADFNCYKCGAPQKKRVSFCSKCGAFKPLGPSEDFELVKEVTATEAPEPVVSETSSSKPTSVLEILVRNKEIGRLSDQGWNIHSLAARFDVDPSTIRTILKSQGRQPVDPSPDIASFEESSTESTAAISPARPVSEKELTISDEKPLKEPPKLAILECPNCGGKVRLLAKFCRECGADLQQLAADRKQPVAPPTIASDIHSSIIATAGAIYKHLSNAPNDFPTAFSFIVRDLWQLVAQMPDSSEKKKLFSEGKELRNLFNQVRKGLISLQEFGEKYGIIPIRGDSTKPPPRLEKEEDWREKYKRTLPRRIGTVEPLWACARCQQIKKEFYTGGLCQICFRLVNKRQPTEEDLIDQDGLDTKNS